MRFANALILIVPVLLATAFAQNPLRQDAPSTPKTVTVPITLDHNRVIIDVYVPLPDGSTKRIRGWVDNGDPELSISQRVAKMMALDITCDATECSAPPPPAIT